MRIVLAGLILSAVVLGGPVDGRADHTTGGEEFGLAIGAAACNLFYLPAKVIVAGGGLVLGSMAAVLTGGSTRAAYSVWVPAASGTYILTPEHFEGEAPVEFLGSDYADTPSPRAGTDGGTVYEALYNSM